MDDGHESSNRNWWTAFLKAKYPAYATLVEPPSIRELDVKAARCQVKAILVDDVLDPAVHKKNGGQSPTQFEIREGSYVLALPDDAEPDRVMVSAPWLCLVNKIWLIPDGDSYKQPSGTTADVQEWERQQIRQGRVSVTNFQLAVTYFYRWSDYFKSVVKDNNNLERLTTAFRRLGVARNRSDTLALLEKRGCGNAPPTQFGMRYVMYSNHQTGDPPGSDDDEDDDDDGDEDSDGLNDPPVPLESIVGVAKVLFLGSNDTLPHHKATPAEMSTVQSTIPDYRTLPPNGKTAVAQQAAAAGQLPPGFICNMFLEVRSSGVVKPRLYGLQEWAEGRAGTNFKQPWVEASRAQVQQLLAVTKNELAQYTTTPHRHQQQPQGHGGAGTSAAAAGASSDEYLDARSSSEDISEDKDHDAEPDDSDDRAQGLGQRLAAATAAGAGQRQERLPAQQQQQQQQRHTPRKVVGLDDSSSSEQPGSSNGNGIEGNYDEGNQDELNHQQQRQRQISKKREKKQQQSGGNNLVPSDGSDDIQIVEDRPDRAAASSDSEQRQQQHDDDQDDGEADSSESDKGSSKTSSSSSDASDSDRKQQQLQQQAGRVSRARQRVNKTHNTTATEAAAAAAATTPAKKVMSITAAVTAASTPAGSKRKRSVASTSAVAAAEAGVAGSSSSSSEGAGSGDDVDRYLGSRDRAAAAAAGGSKRRKQRRSKQAAAAAAGVGDKSVRERQTTGSKERSGSAARQLQRHTS